MEKIMDINNTYRTSDLHLAAFLKAKGMRILDTKKNGGRSTFIFGDKGNSKELIQEFFNDGMVSITAFKNALQDLKTMVFNV
jgi:hypothetical protein